MWKKVGTYQNMEKMKSCEYFLDAFYNNYVELISPILLNYSVSINMSVFLLACVLHDKFELSQGQIRPSCR